MPLKVGTLVKRLSNVFDDNSEMLVGIVAKGPYSFQSQYGFYPECYDVLWQQRDKICKGYFRYGLRLVEKD